MATQIASKALATDDTLKRIAVCLENNGTLSELHTTDKTSLVAAINEVKDEETAITTETKCLVVTKNSVTELPQTIVNPAITSDMVCIHSEFSSPDVYVNATVTTTDGGLTISGTVSRTTNITLYLIKSR